MILYQLNNSSNEYNNDIKIYNDLFYVTHLHRDFELVYMLEGSANAVVEDKKYTLNKGQMLMVLSNQIHSYSSERKNRALVHVFSADNVPSFARAVRDKNADDPIFVPDDDVAEYYLKCCTDRAGERPFRYKSCLYGACGQFLAKCVLTDQKNQSDGILHRMLAFISEHFREDITLEKLSSELGYEPHYLSRVFGRSVGMNIKKYINQYRVDQAKYMLLDSSESITEIALSSGFQSIRSFNRAFFENTGMTPQELRRGGSV